MEEVAAGWHATVYVNDAAVAWTQGEREEVLEQLRRAGVQTVVWPPAPISVIRVTRDGGRELPFTGKKPRRGNE